MKPSTMILLFLFAITKATGQFQSISGTTIIAYLTKDSIWLAADSKEISDDGKQVLHHLKIRTVKNITFAIAGKSSWIAPGNREVFNAFQLLTFSLKSHKNLDSAVNFFRQRVEKSIDSIYTALPRKQGSERKKTYFHKGELITILATFVNNKPIFKEIDFGFTEQNGDTVYTSLMANRNIMGPEIIPYGFSDEILEKINNPAFRPWRPTKNMLTDLIILEVKKYPDFVGLPIDVLVIYRNGHKFLTANKYP